MCRIHDEDLPTEEQRREIDCALMKLELPSLYIPVIDPGDRAAVIEWYGEVLKHRPDLWKDPRTPGEKLFPEK